MVSAHRSRSDSAAIWLVPGFWLAVFSVLTVRDIAQNGEPNGRLLQVICVELLIVLLLCIPLAIRVKRITIDEALVTVQYYLRPARKHEWSDIASLDHLQFSASDERLLRLKFSRGRPVAITRAMVNFESVESALLSRSDLSVNTNPGILDRIFQ